VSTATPGGPVNILNSYPEPERWKIPSLTAVGTQLMFDDRRQLQTVYVQMQIDTKLVIFEYFDPFRQKLPVDKCVLNFALLFL